MFYNYLLSIAEALKKPINHEHIKKIVKTNESILNNIILSYMLGDYHVGGNDIQDNINKIFKEISHSIDESAKGMRTAQQTIKKMGDAIKFNNLLIKYINILGEKAKTADIRLLEIQLKDFQKYLDSLTQ